ncbi:MAG: hypothetical protein FJ096_08090 [Deltaproteobacteria bacterium]|nr:hypothetical protein [Deltaproteobacteria bacterium]
MSGDERDEALERELPRPGTTAAPSRGRPGVARASSPSPDSSPSLEGFDSDALFADAFGTPDDPDFERLFPTADVGNAGVPPQLSPEIRSLLASSLAHARQLPSGSTSMRSDEVLVDAQVLAELAELLPSVDAREPGAEPMASPGSVVPERPSSGLSSARLGPSRLPVDSAAPTAREPMESIPPTRADAATRLPPSTGELAPRPTILDALFSGPPGDLASWAPNPPSLNAPRSASFSPLAPSNPAPIEALVGDTRGPERPPDAAPTGSTEPGDATSRVQDVDALDALARAVREGSTGVLELASADGRRCRQVVFRDGDPVVATTSAADESILDMLAERGDLDGRLARERSHHLPRAGRHAVAALIAQGFLAQDELWSVLRAHAEWTLARALREPSTRCRFLAALPEHLTDEPSVFGGSTGVEVFVEVVRRTLGVEEGRRRLEERGARFVRGPRFSRLHEAALDPAELEAVEALLRDGETEPFSEDLAPLLLALSLIEIISAESGPTSGSGAIKPDARALDDAAIRLRVASRRALVAESDYFTLLGVRPDASGHELRRTFLELRRAFEPARLLTPGTRDLEPDVRLIIEVLEEAYRILSDDARRNRYRIAITATRG